jgi:arginyl-tRNA synthetase
MISHMFRQWLHDTLTRLYPSHLFDVLVPPDQKLGDYSVNLAFVLAKKEKKNPREVAQEICDALTKEGGEMIEKCEIAGPGFVNVFLKDAYLQAQLGKADVPDVGQGKRVIVEYSSPNIAKPMHIGHLRSTVIGDALANVYAALGYDVVRWNYIGDWGTQFGKLIAGYKKWKPDVATIHDMVQLYVRANKELDESAGREEFQKLEAGDSENRKLWEEFRDISLKEFERMYAQFGTSFTITKGESDYEPELKPLIEELTSRGFAKESEGALIVDLADEGLPPGLLRKSDGATLYLTRDIASLRDRITEYHPAKILYVVANQQALHFEQLFAIKDKLKLGDTETVHVKFGMVLGEDGKKFATREGNAIPLQDVVDKVVALAAERNPDTAQAIGIGALKYNDLRQHPYSDITFDWKAMLDLGGNSGPYLQYTYARLAGIIAKVGHVKGHPLQDGKGAPSQLHPAERALMRHLLDFGDAVAQCAQLHTLNGLALYLYEFAERANRFYEQVRVSEDENPARKAARLELVRAVMATLKQGLELLGIQVLDRI